MSPASNNKNISLHIWLLIGWLAIATALRFYHLDSKPVWSDEWATIAFSLGRGFRSIPLDRVITSDILLQPLQVDGTTQAKDVIARLMSESNHPPIYFLLTHWWLKLFSGQDGLVSLWGARSLSALFGIISIPAIFGLGWLGFRSLLVAHIAAALMAVSPFAIYLAQEARHYTITIIAVIASLGCLVVAVRHLRQRLNLPTWIVLAWAGINNIAIATHYFFVLTLMAQMLVLASVWLADIKMAAIRKMGVLALFPAHWLRIYATVAGTAMGGFVWLSVWQTIPEDRLVDWIYHGQRLGLSFLEPIGRSLAWLITMFFLLPIEHAPPLVAIASAVTILLLLGWLMPSFVRCWRQPLNSLTTRIFGGFVLSAIALILTITYVKGTDLTLAARYQFIYFPAVILLMAAVLAQIWQIVPVSYFPAQGKSAVIIVLVMSLLGGLTVIFDLGFQKPDRSDLLVARAIEAHQLVSPDTPILFANLHKTHEQTGEMMGLAWEFKEIKPSYPVQFLLAHQANDDNPTATVTLHRAIDRLARPFQLWLVNFPTSEAELEVRRCDRNADFKGKVAGYHYDLFYCPK
jgi:uncharacterized membrane protein